MKFLDILLKEGRKEDLKKKYSNKFDDEVLDFVLGIADLQDFNHKYTDFVLKVTDPKIDASPEWFELIIDNVKLFDKYQSQLKKKDINQYSSFSELEKALSPFKTKEQEKELEKQVDKIYEDNDFLVVSPKTQEASCAYGSGTKWCTTQRSGGHFERYTGANQGLYYIIRKQGKNTETNYKIAIHFNNMGLQFWYDAKDNPMNPQSIELFREYFPNLYKAVLQNYKTHKRDDEQNLLKTFDTKSESKRYRHNFMGLGKSLGVRVKGFDNVPDMKGHAIGELQIYYEDEIIDKYDIMVTYQGEEGTWHTDTGFSGDFLDFEPKVDLGGENWDFKTQYPSYDTPEQMWSQYANSLISDVLNKLNGNNELIKYVTKSTGPVWRPDRHNYGYTFARNKGLISKLISWLDDGKIGTKLDFLTDIGKLDKKVENGKQFFSKKGGNYFEPSARWRGHFASFFASAKNAGILNYRKVGSNYLLTKGPNFDDYKQGKLTAL